MNLSELKAGQSCEIKSVNGEGVLRQHFLDMGIIPGHNITFMKAAPMGDPLEFTISGYEITLRKDEATRIEVTNVGVEIPPIPQPDISRRAKHPGYGQNGIYHSKKDENPLPEGTIISFALLGQQNCGKTTLFNALTGSNQHVGNFPGVTVDRKEGSIRGYSDTTIVDLPGIYSMSPYSAEEIVSRNYVLDDKPRGIINCVDGTNIERNLYLTLQAMELGKPMVLAVNMMDELHNNSGEILVNEMEEMLGIPVVPISAAKGEGIEELMDHAYHVAKYQEYPEKIDYCDEKDNGGAIHRALHAIMHLIDDHAKKYDIPVRFAAAKLAEGDEDLLERLKLDQNEKEMLEHIIIQMENESGLDRAAAIASMRYDFIRKVCEKSVIRPKESKEHIRSAKIDKLLTGKYTAIPCFVLIMAAIFFLTFNVIGAGLQNLMTRGISALGGQIDTVMTNAGVNKTLHSLVIDGIFGGVGNVLSFLPIIVVLFLFLSLLEDSGYLARVAFVMDKPLRKLGLSGKSIVPLLVGFGCSVPAVMATRTLSSERDRKMTILLTPFMSCPAKLPIYAFFAAAFFPKTAGLITIGLYILGILMGILMSYIYRKTLFKGNASPFVMELPNYRMPGFRNTMFLLWEKAKDFLSKAFTVILLATIIVWFLETFDFGFNVVSDSATSMLATVSGIIAPIFAPIGLGDWRLVTSMISGFIAKESVVSTLSVLMGDGLLVTGIMTSAQAASMLVFSLLYTPCVAAISAIRRELGRKWAVGVVVIQCLIAYVAALAVYLIGGVLL